MKATFRDVEKFTKALRKGNIRMEPKYHLIRPQIFHARPCSICGSLEHRKCDRSPKCLRCTSNSHATHQCESRQFKCLNCEGKHPTTSEICNALAEETFRLNDRLIKILIDERVIKNKFQILDVQMRERERAHSECETKRLEEETMKHSMSEMNMNMIKMLIDDRVKSYENKQSEINKELFARMDNYDKAQKAMYEKVDKLVNRVDSIEITIRKGFDAQQIKNDSMHNMLEQILKNTTK